MGATPIAARAEDPSRVFYWGDFVTDGSDNAELFAISDFATADQSPAAVRIESVPLGGDVLGFRVVPEPAGAWPIAAGIAAVWALRPSAPSRRRLCRRRVDRERY